MDKTFSAFKEHTIEQRIDAQVTRKRGGIGMGWGHGASR